MDKKWQKIESNYLGKSTRILGKQVFLDTVVTWTNDELPCPRNKMSASFLRNAK